LTAESRSRTGTVEGDDLALESRREDRLEEGNGSAAASWSDLLTLEEHPSGHHQQVASAPLNQGVDLSREQE
jgi:hypothetical protein